MKKTITINVHPCEGRWAVSVTEPSWRRHHFDFECDAVAWGCVIRAESFNSNFSHIEAIGRDGWWFEDK